jgi:hypothetical protein
VTSGQFPPRPAGFSAARGRAPANVWRSKSDPARRGGLGRETLALDLPLQPVSRDLLTRDAKAHETKLALIQQVGRLIGEARTVTRAASL